MVDAQPFLVAMTSVVLTSAIAIEGYIGKMCIANRNRIIALESSG